MNSSNDERTISIKVPRFLGRFFPKTPEVDRYAAEAEEAGPLIRGQKLKGSAAIEGHLFDSVPVSHQSELVKKKGLKVFRTMRREDDACSTGSGFLSLAVISPKWGVRTQGADGLDEKARDLVDFNLRTMNGTFSQTILFALQALYDGFSVCEPVYGDQISEGDFLGKQPIRKIASKDPYFIDFKVDSYGEIEEKGLWQQKYSGGGSWTKEDVEEFLYLAFNPENDDPYGSSLLLPAYPSYFMKKLTLKTWARFLERHGVPTAIGRTQTIEKSMDSTYREKFLAFLEQLRMNLSTVLPKEWEVELVQPDMRANTDTFEKAIAVANRAIFRSLLLPSRVFEGGETGSYSQTKDQSQNQFAWVLRFVSDWVMEAFNSQVIRPFVLHNFGTRVAVPEVYIQDYVEEDLQAKATLFKVLSDMGLPFSLSQIRGIFGVDEPVSPEDTFGGTRPAPPMLSPELGEAETNALVRDYTEIVGDWSYGNLLPRKTYSFPSEGKETNSQNGGCSGGRKNDRPLTPIETVENFAEQTRRIDDDVEESSENIAILLESIAGEVEEIAGKDLSILRLG